MTRPDRDPAVVISLREYESLKETAFLLGIPANARHLAASIESLRGGLPQRSRRHRQAGLRIKGRSAPP